MSRALKKDQVENFLRTRFPKCQDEIDEFLKEIMLDVHGRTQYMQYSDVEGVFQSQLEMETLSKKDMSVMKKVPRKHRRSQEDADAETEGS